MPITISALIAKLESLKAKHGDLPVIVGLESQGACEFKAARKFTDQDGKACIEIVGDDSGT